MNTVSSVADVVIIGAGIAGAATAWSLSERSPGARIVLIDPRPPMSLTSHRPEANYRVWWPHPAMVQLTQRSLERIDDLRRDGANIPMDRRGYLFISDIPDTADGLADIVATHQATKAAQAEVLDGDSLHRRWPHLGPDVAAAIFIRRAGSLDTVALGRAMLQRAENRGVRFVRGEVDGIGVTGGRVTGVAVRTADGPISISSDVIVDAAGPFAGNVARLAGISLPLETVLRQKVVVHDIAGVIPRDAPFTITLDGRSLPWTTTERTELAADPRTRRLLDPLPPGIHVKPDDTGGPAAIKIGWAWDPTPVSPVERAAGPPEFPLMVLRGASTVVPGLARYADAMTGNGPGPVIGHEGGLYARTPDGRPLIGAAGSGAPSGFFLAAALAGFGAMMGAGVGEIVANWVVSRDATDVSADPFDPRRFEDRAYLAEIQAGTVPTGEL